MADDLILPGQPMDGRLGRRFAGHDERSREYGVRPLLASTVERKPTFWALPGQGPFPLDQGREGACTGFGSAHELAAGPVHVGGMTNEFAMDLYRRIQATDRAAGRNFPDGATVLATMQTLKAENRITAYRWAFGIDDVVDTLCTAGPVCLGIEWRYNMYFTRPGGKVEVTGDVVGGHFLTAIAYDVHPQWGPVVGWLNSWGADYGVADPRLNAPGGIGWITLRDLSALLARWGEAAVPADFFVAPEPTPEPIPAPIPEPTPRPDEEAPYFAVENSSVYHDNHRSIDRDRVFWTKDEATNAGLRPCRICRP